MAIAKPPGATPASLFPGEFCPNCGLAIHPGPTALPGPAALPRTEGVTALVVVPQTPGAFEAAALKVPAAEPGEGLSLVPVVALAAPPAKKGAAK